MNQRQIMLSGGVGAKLTKNMVWWPFLRLLGWAVAWSTKEHVTINLLAMSRRTTMT